VVSNIDRVNGIDIKIDPFFQIKRIVEIINLNITIYSSRQNEFIETYD